MDVDDVAETCVVAVIPCDVTQHPSWCVHARRSGTTCNGCLGSGYRLDVEHARPVERSPSWDVVLYDDGIDYLETWVELP